MQKIPKKLEKSLDRRKEANALRVLPVPGQVQDFSSNDYLGLSTSIQIFEEADRILRDKNVLKNGATGSRLLTGNHLLYPVVERELAQFFFADEALVYNSGYDANLGFFSCIPQRDDLVFYDELAHASIRDGISLGRAKAYKFRHNDISDLEQRIQKVREKKVDGEIYVVTEGIFSMDGDSPDLKKLIPVCKKLRALLIVDEAHSAGVVGKTGSGLVVEMGLEHEVFARVVTFGKAFGVHGAAILGSPSLKSYLVNFSRSLMYTTALPPHSVACLLAAIKLFPRLGAREIDKLQRNISYFKNQVSLQGLENYFHCTDSPVQTLRIGGNDSVKQLASFLFQKGFDVKPILSPTIPKGDERLRFCIHSNHSFEALKEVLTLLSGELQKTDGQK